MKEFVLTHVVKNVSSLKESQPHFGKVEEHFGADWQLKFYRKINKLAVFLYCENSCDTGEWSISANFELKLLSANGKTMALATTAVFSNSSDDPTDSWGFHPFIDWKSLEKEYIVKDTVTIEAHVTIEKMSGIEKKKLRDFDDSAAEVSDLVLIVENEKFYVSKLFLAGQSSYFKSLLLGKFQESEKSEITLSDINPMDFQNFLEILHGESAIDDNTIEGILHLADMYDAKTVMRQCEEFLMRDSDKSKIEKFKLSADYNLGNSRNKFLSEIKTVEDIRSVVSGDLTEMGAPVLAALLQKSLSFH